MYNQGFLLKKELGIILISSFYFFYFQNTIVNSQIALVVSANP